MLTRNYIKKSRIKARKFFLQEQKYGTSSNIYKSAKFILRNDRFCINYSGALTCLDNIEFIYDPIHKHWAETDGIEISLNTYKTFTPKLLTDTLIHEALHGIILRERRHFIPEDKEHTMMKMINSDLI